MYLANGGAAAGTLYGHPDNILYFSDMTYRFGRSNQIGHLSKRRQTKTSKTKTADSCESASRSGSSCTHFGRR